MPETLPHPLIAEHDLAPHPEGGWYRETMRRPDPKGGRALATAILFLLEDGQRSHWHRIDANELWLWHAGSPLTLWVDHAEHTLSAKNPQGLVPVGAWQAADAHRGWALVSCVVTPGFEFEGFELAASDWSP